jgi:phosphoheptose isomerase
LRNRVLNQLSDMAALVDAARGKADLLVEAAQMIAEAFAGGKKVLLFGNGGTWPPSS